jgi:hypothetical protein
MATGRGARPPDPKPRDEDAARGRKHAGSPPPKPADPNVEQQVERMENEGGPPGVKRARQDPANPQCGETP